MKPEPELFAYDEIPTVARLTASDRCDVKSCGAQAYVTVGFWPNDGGPVDLLFCGHHFTKFEKSIREKATHIFDERSRITDAEGTRKDFYVG